MKSILDTHPRRTRFAVSYALPLGVMSTPVALDLLGDAFRRSDISYMPFALLLLAVALWSYGAWYEACDRLGVRDAIAFVTAVVGAVSATALYGCVAPCAVPYGNTMVVGWLLFQGLVFSGLLLAVVVFHLILLRSLSRPAPDKDQRRRYRAL